MPVEGRVELLLLAMREQASRTIMFHGVVADLVGLGPSDMKALDLARSEVNLTAGRLAQITGLSTSATTAVLDRLERRGLVERRRDPRDRRKVVVVATGRFDERVLGVFAELERLCRDELADYDDRQLELLLGFVRRFNDATERFTKSLLQGQ